MFLKVKCRENIDEDTAVEISIIHRTMNIEQGVFEDAREFCEGKCRGEKDENKTVEIFHQ